MLTKLYACVSFCNPTHTMKGPISSFIGQMTDLRAMDLVVNKLTGTLPTEFAMLSKMTWASLLNNELTGTIPTILGTGLSSMEKLFLDNNRFTGTIPTGKKMFIFLQQLSCLEEFPLLVSPSFSPACL